MSSFIYLDFHTHQFTQREQVIEIVNHFWGMEISTPFASIGNHPAYLGSPSLLQTQNCVCIGESGLDKNCATPWEQQIEAFIADIRLSEQLKKPLIVHCVKSYQEILGIRQQQQAQMPWIFHGFRKNKALLMQILAANCFVSFGASLCHENAAVTEMVLAAPIERIFLETDHQTQIPIELIYEKYAAIKGIAVSTLCAQMLKNATNIGISFHEEIP